MKNITSILFLLLAGCSSNIDYDPRHRPLPLGAKQNHYYQLYPWLADYDKIKRETYIEDVNDCSDKASKLASLHNGYYVVFKKENKLHAVVYFDDGYLVDPTHGAILKVYSRKWLNTYPEKCGWGVFVRIEDKY